MANSTEQKIIQDTIKSFFNDFNKQTINITLESNNALLEKISAYFVDRLNPNSENSFNKKTTVDELTSDIKKTTYYNIKTIYDKICGVNDEQSTTVNDEKPTKLIEKIEDLNKINIENLSKQRLFYNLKFSSEECFGEGENQNIVDYDLYQIFQIVDRGNNDIGTKVLADLGYLYENLYAEFDSQPIAGQPDKNITVNNLTKGSFQKLFSGLATQSGFLFQQIPNYLNLNSAISGDDDDIINRVVDDLFGVHQTTNLAGAEIFKNKNNTKFGGLFGLPGYIFQLGTTTSSTDNQEKVQVNDYTNSFCLDIGLDSNNEINIRDENTPDEIKNSNITCFAVDFATQKQQMFNNIQLDTNEFYDTEESIRTWVDAVNSNDQYIQTTNLFPILEKRSYTCTVSGLGNATIQPLSYFYLRNVPLFHGTYWITNVSHKINQNTMSTTFQGVRQPIISKQDVRKQLLELMRKKADALLKASDTANRVITEGIGDTEGDIKQIDNSDKQYGAIIQQRKDDNGYQEFDAKILIGSFIYSITGSNDDKDPNNLGVISTLYNQSRAYTNSEDHSTIIKNIKNIVVGKIKIGAKDGDKRYCQNKDEPSLSVLYKNSGYSNIGKLSTLLDDIISESEYNRLIKLDKNIQYYGLTTNPVVSQDTNATLQLQLGSPITTFKSENILINQATLYFDHDTNSIIKNNTPWSGSEFDGNFLNTYDIISTFSGNTINTVVTVKGISIKYLGTFSPESGKKVSFYSVNNGKINWGANTKKDYDIVAATTDDLNQLFSDPNKNIINGAQRYVFLNNMKTIAIREQNKWRDSTGQLIKECDDSVKNYLNAYWLAANTTLEKMGGCSVAWSAAFISYVVKESGATAFPYATAHAVYIVKSRDNKNSGGSYPWFAYDSRTKEAKVEVGDLVCYGRQGAAGKKLSDINIGDATHCDIITSIDDKFMAQGIGGNIGSTVGTTNYQLNSDFTIDTSKSKAIAVLKYQPIETSITNTITNTSDKGKSETGFERGSVESSSAETQSFLIDVLKGIGIGKPNNSQLKFMTAWRQHEGGKAAWNPFNTTLDKENSSKYNQVPVRNYPDRKTGLEATIQTLKNGKYDKVIKAINNIKQDSDIDTAMIAVNDSPWGSKFNPTNHKSWVTLNNFIWKTPTINA